MPFVTVPLDGGLDLQTPPIGTTPGRLQACDNFEVSTTTGYRRVDGYERYDGGPSPSTSDCIRVQVSGDASGKVGYLGTVQQDGKTIAKIVVVHAARATNRGVATDLYIRPTTTYVPWKGDGVSVILHPASLSSVSAVTHTVLSAPSYPLLDGTFTASAWQAIVDKAYLNIRAGVRQVPGTGPVVGLFWMRDALYAARDYLAFSATSIDATLAPDDSVSGTGFSAAVFSVDRSEDGTGTVVLHSVIGTFTAGDVKRAGSTIATATGTTASPGAGLYKAVGARGAPPAGASWVHQSLGHTLRFKDGTADFPALNRITGGQPDAAIVQKTPWVVAAAVTAQACLVSGTTTVPDALSAGDGDTKYVSFTNEISYATGGTGRPYFKINQFGLAATDLPDGSAITGIEVEVTRRVANAASHTITVNDSRVWFEYAGSPRLNVADAQTSWPATYTAATYGSATNLLGCTNLTPALARDNSFSLFFEATFTPFTVVGTPYSDGRVTLVRMRMHYVPPQPSFYIWNGSTAQVVHIVKSYPDAGAAADSNLAGALYVMVDGVARAVGSGEEIRSMPQPGTNPDGGATDGSTLIAHTDTAMARNFLDGSAMIAAAGSRYRHVTANFFGSADFEAIHGVSGAGPAFLYDGYAFARILTGTPIEKDTPRHVASHQGRLFLGYPSGSVQFSAPSDPLDFSGVNLAGEVGVASPVRGMYSLNGQTLAIFTRDNVQMLQGDVGAPTMGFISPTNGCIEYTACSTGDYLYTSNRGLEVMAQTPSYGDFTNQPLSQLVSPWLTRRVQRSVQFEGEAIGVLDSLPVRNKRQFRLFFADGKILTATFLNPDQPPQFTTQTHPVIWSCLLAATESTGRDRLFGAHTDGYVYELDRGNRFDLDPVTATITLAVDDQKASFVQKQYTDAHVHGIVTDFGTFTLSRAVNYDTADATYTEPQLFGAEANNATGQVSYAVSFTPIRTSGRSVSLRFDLSTVTQPPVTLQAVSYNVVPMGEKRT